VKIKIDLRTKDIVNKEEASNEAEYIATNTHVLGDNL
jgi:hypothetical protein